MIRIIFIGLMLTVSSFIFAGKTSTVISKETTVLVSGKVVDKISGEEITGAEILIDNKIVYSDLNGNFTALININNVDAEIKYISYKDTKVKVNPFSYNTITIELASK